MAAAVAALGLLAAALLATGAGAAGAAGTPGKRALTIYSVATGVQYINTADDRERGQTNNPLDAGTRKLAPKSADTGNGPFAGDVAVYALDLFSNPTLKKATGTGVYTCYFNYNQRAFCKAYFKLPGGSTLVASGPIDFKESGFTIVVTGGTQRYLGVRGEVKVAPAPNNAQRLDFNLLG